MRGYWKLTRYGALVGVCLFLQSVVFAEVVREPPGLPASQAPVQRTATAPFPATPRVEDLGIASRTNKRCHLSVPVSHYWH